jgi:hypothetical protein
MEEENKNNETPKKSEEKPKTRARRTRKTSSEKSEEGKKTEGRGRRSTASKKEEQVADEKKPTNLAESVAYLHAIGLKKVSNKTFINEVDLEAFLKEDFSNINKTKAFGFIQILEREYPVKLQDLRKSYLEYYQQHKPKEPKELFVHAKGESDSILKKYLVWGIAALFVFGALWYLLSDRESDLSKLESEDKTVVQDLNNDVVQKAEAHLAILEENETKATKAASEPEVKSERETVKKVSSRAVPFVKGAAANSTLLQQAVTQKGNQTQAHTLTETKQDAAKKSQKTDKPDEDLDLDAMVKQMVQEYNLTDVAAEDSEKNASSQMEQKEQKKTETAATDIKTVPSKVVKTEAVKKVKSEKSAEKSLKQTTPKEQKKRLSKSDINSKLYIVPNKKSWVGVIYLDDYTKKDFLIRRTLKLDPTRPQLIVVGHKDFEIYSNGYSYRFRGKGPVRFIYKNGDIMEINSREFRKFSKGAAW